MKHGSNGSSQDHRVKGAFLAEREEVIHQVWGRRQREQLAGLVDLPGEVVTRENLDRHVAWLQDTRVLFSTWSMPCLSHGELDRMPNLQAVFYAAGTVKHFASPLFERNITVVSAWAANAIPVAEFALAQILFGLKLGWQHQRQFQQTRGPAGWKHLPVPGVYGATVGIISLGMTGRKVCQLLQPFSVQKLAFDPYVPDGTLHELGVTRAVDLSEIFSTCDVVTLHTPWLKETEGFITGKLFASMKPNATFINTSRGALVREDEMIEVLRQRPDLTAVLDVTWPEPPAADSALYHLPNIVLSPHIAGSAGNEVLRMADLMIEEFTLWSKDRPLRYAVSRELMERLA